MKDKRILITGHKGFIGSYLWNRLKQDNYVHGLDLPEMDITDMNNVEELCESTDYVFHMAAISDINSCEKDRARANLINVTGTLNILNAAKLANVKKVIFASSAAVYKPNSMYGVSKLNAEAYCNYYSMYQGLPVVTLRFFNIYGYGQNNNAIIPAIINKALKNEKPLITGNGLQTRDFIYIDDIVDACIKAADVIPYGISDVGTGEDTTINQLVRLIGELMNRKIEVEYGSGDVGILYSKADKKAWFNPKYSLKQGINKMLEAYGCKTL